MSNLLKSKFLLGVMTVAIMFVGLAFANTASADCSLTTTLRVGSKGVEVKCLQTVVGATADGSFGPKTKVAVMAWQSGKGLVADGVVGPKSRAVFNALGGSVSGNFPAGCTSASGYSSTTGAACTSVNANTFAPAGCTNASGFSPVTGAACYSVSANTFPAGCTSASGFSSTTGASCATGAVNNQTGPVAVSLATDNPASGYIIANQATADLAHFTFTGVGTLNSVTLQRTGVSDQNTLSNVYLFDGNTRLTDGYSFNNVGQLTMNGLGLAINGSRTISVKADVASVLNASSLGVTLTSFTAAGGTPTAVSVMGNQMTYGVGSLATAFLGVNTVIGTPTVNAGTSAYTVWSAPVQVNVRAVWLKGANFRMTGSAPADALGNIRLFVDGVAVGSAATLGTITGSNYAMFNFPTPVSLSTGSHTIDVRADVVKGASYTVQVSLQQSSDLVLYDGQIGVNIAALGPIGVAFTSNNAATITIAAGSASVVVDPTFSTMTNVTGGATNVAIGRFKVHGYGEDVKVSTLLVTPVLTGCTPACAGLNNLTVYFNGAQVGSSQTWTAGVATFNLGSQMIIPAGTDSYIEVRADLQTNAGVNYTLGNVSANLTSSTNNAQGQTSHTTLNFPTGTVAGTVLAVQAGTLAVSKNTAYASQVASPNTAGVKIGSFVLQNQSTSESVRVTSLLVALSGTTALTNLSNLRTSETSGSGSNPIQPAASNTFSVNFTVAPGATKIIDVLADTGGSTGVVVVNVNTVAQTLVVNNAATPAANGVKASTSTVIAGTATTGQTTTITINGLATVLNETTGQTAIQQATALVAAINANTQVSGTITASNVGGTSATVTITANTAGTAGNNITVTKAVGTGNTATVPTSPMTGGTNNTAQISTLTPANVEIADIFTAGSGTTNVSFTAAAATVANVTAGLTAAWNANTTLAAIATASDGSTVVNLTAVVSGTAGAFTATSSTTNGSVAGTGTVIASLTVTSIGATSNVSLAQNGNGTAVVGQTITLGAGTVASPTLSSSSTSAQYVASANGVTNGTRATYTFISAGGPAVVTELTFNIIGSNPGAVASVTVNGLTAPVVGTTAYITGLSIAVPNGGAGVDQDVFVTYTPVGTSGILSGTTSTLSLTTVKYTSGGVTTIIPGLTINAPQMTMVGSKPVVAFGLPNGAAGTSVSGLSVGLLYVADVKVTADAQGAIKVVTLPLKFTGSQAGTTITITDATNLVIKDSSGAVITNYTVGSITGSASAAATAIITFTGGGYQVAANTTATFKVNVTVGAVAAGTGNSLATGITPGTSFTWTDTAGAGAAGAGTGAAAVMPSYPTSTVSMTN